MTVLIVTSFGATHKYRDRDMMRLTFGGFLHSIRRQTDRDFRLIVSYHDKPEGVKCDDPWIVWCPVSGSPDHEWTVVPVDYPRRPNYPIETQKVTYGGLMTDMSRKTYNSVMWAGKYAYREHLSSFWMLRMDSDDLLANDVVANLHKAQDQGIRAVYNRTCHMFDPKRKEIAVHAYPYSTTCNALLYRFKEEGELFPDWYYHCTDHTLFKDHVHKDKIPSLDLNYTLCILTNSGNSISERGEIDKEQHTKKIPLTQELIERYGLETLL